VRVNAQKGRGLSLAGVLIGLPLAVAGAHLLRSMLFTCRVEPGDPRIFGAAVFGIVAVAILSSLIPARRAASVDPIVALRFE
jgi:ABC-type antimicrobial peptide transport system permease subunit